VRRDGQRLDAAAAEARDRDLLGIDAAVIGAAGTRVFRERPVDRSAELLGTRRRVALHARALGPRWRFRLTGAVVDAAGRDREITVRRDVQEMQPRARAVVRAAAIAEHVNAELRVTETREVRRAVHDVVRQPRVDLLHWR